MKFNSQSSGLHAQRTNAFDALRIGAALAVLFSHSFPIVGLAEPTLASAGLTLGTLSVGMFFCLSGCLVGRSWDRDPNIGRFTARRALRIFPGLIVSVAFTTFVVGSIATQLTGSQYFSSIESWGFFLSNALMIGGVLDLPGAFESNPLRAANGSLWTLRYEVLMYALLVAVAKIAPLRLTGKFMFLVFLGSWLGLTALELSRLQVPLPLVWRIGLEIDAVHVARLGTFFFGGVAIQKLERAGAADRFLAAALWVIVAFAPTKTAANLTLAFAVPYSMMVLAYGLPKFLRWKGSQDWSFGVYVYAFPIQQLVAIWYFKHQLTWFASTAIALCMTLACAAISWHVVEKPALAFKPKVKPNKFSEPNAPLH